MKKILFYSLIIVLLASGARVSQAASTYTLLAPLPCISTTGHPCATNAPPIKEFTINTFIEYVFKFSIALAVLLATIMIIWGGFEYMLSEAPFVKLDAKEKFKNAGLGLAGALLSYLILQTIDPRLVQINTTIPAICPQGLLDDKNSVCYKNAGADFNKSLSDDLKALTTEKQNEVKALETKKTQIEQQKQDLQNRYLYSQDPSDPNYITKEQYNTKIAELDAQTATLNVGQSKIIADGLGITNFQTAHDIIYSQTGALKRGDLEQYTADPILDTKQDGKFPTDSQNAIQNIYNRKINEVLAINPQNAESTELLRTLSLEKRFYIAQVKEEVELKKKLEGETVNAGADQGSYTSIDKSYLETKLKEYQANLKDPQKPINAGIDPVVYTKIMQARIDNINQVLTPVKK